MCIRDSPYKVWKLTDEDWRNREKWDRYGEAVDEMLLKTSTLSAPWTIVEGNNKWWSRVRVLRTVVESLCRELDYVPDICLLYTSDAADERSSVDLGGRRIIKKKKNRGAGRSRRNKDTNKHSDTN